MQIDVDMDSVTIDGTTVVRKPWTSRSYWMKFWDRVKTIADGEAVVKMKDFLT